MAYEVNTDSPMYKAMTPDQQQQVQQMAQSGNIPPSVDQLYSSLQQTKISTEATQAQIPGIQAQSAKEGIQAQQAASPLNLKGDLSNHMTLKSALSKYTALGMNADDVFKSYLAQSPWGLPNESPTELQNMGISPQALGQIGQNGSFADRYNTKNAIQGLRALKDSFSQVSGLSKLPFLANATPSGQGYEAARQVFGEHLSSLIPGAPGGQGPTQDLINTIPNGGDIHQLEPGAAAAKFSAVEKQLLNTKGYNYKDLGLNSPLPQKQVSGKDVLNNIINATLPTGGAIAGGIAGGGLGALIPGADLTGAPEVAGAIAGSGAGGAGGQALADLLTGKKPGADVAITGGLSAAGEGVGAGLGAILGKVGGALSNRVSSGVFDKVVSASPNYTTDIATLKNTANKYGLMGGSTADGLAQMPKVMSDIGTKIQAGLSQVKTPVKLSDVEKSILDDFSKKTNSFENTSDFDNARKYISDRLYSATGNDNPLSKILDKNGAQMTKPNAQTTYSDLYNLKSEVAKDLKPVFKAQSNPNLPTNFTPKQEANLALWDGLKNEIDKADPNIRVLNDDQHNMFDVAKGFVKDATSRKGGGGIVGDIFDVLAGNMAGGLPGALAVHTIRRGLATEGGKAALSKALQSGVVKQGLRVGGATTGSGLGAMLGLSQ